jgi:hypothetical protein
VAALQTAKRKPLCRRIEEYEPNEETIAALKEADLIARDPNARTYSSPAELFAELRAECTK